MKTRAPHPIAAGLAAAFICGILQMAAAPAALAAAPTSARIIFLHHSTGECIWNGGVAGWFQSYNAAHKTDYRITQQNFPKDSPYGWENYPYDYWNIWVNHAGNSPYKNEPTLEILTRTHHVIVFKHCFPVSSIEADTGRGDIRSSAKRIENYKLQYEALKKKMRQFRQVKFILWTGAVSVQADMDEQTGRRAKAFFDWVRTRWDEKGDNIFLWDFYRLETEGGLYLKPQHARSAGDSHPNEGFSRKVAPYFCQRIVDVISGRGDKTSITGTGGKPLPRVSVTGTRPAPTTSPVVGPARTRPATAPAPEIVSTGPGKWLFDNAEDPALAKQRWSAGAGHAKDGDQRVIKITFADGKLEDWGEYGKQRIVHSRRPARNFDLTRYKYLALRVKVDREMEIVFGVTTMADPAAGPEHLYFGFNAYLHPKPGRWNWVVLDLGKLELDVQDPKAYEKASKPNRPMQLTCLKLVTNVKNEKAAVALDDITFLRDLPKALRPYLQQP